MGERLQGNVEDEADIADLGYGQVFENWYQVEELVVVGVREPGADGDGVLRVEDVRSWRVVDDDGIFQITANL